MRRPGFLNGTTYWFGDACWICENGGRCKNICTTKVQKKKLKKRFKAQRVIAKKTRIKRVLPRVDVTRFYLEEGESQFDRLKRLKSEGLYTPGSRMSLDYSNLVHFGTSNRARVVEIKIQREIRAREHLKRALSE